ncbi:methionine ABC transporter permease [Oerskovia jenensis]|uniref:D-methionine transport system permease protein n=1 Tax=Oerskovia jenensis TaxID=162169 RepID=A0ABS2LEG1_9CELL|nr:methionine ABC transporter permease [Oerskovia jenensis]MBM7478813.1 D-methionine transport system permease protein [Oerskovia jenensis]
MENVVAAFPDLLVALGQTLYMLAICWPVGIVLGLTVAVLLRVTSADGLRPHRAWFAVLNGIVNLGRSVPFLLLAVLMVPVTRLIVGTAIGTTAATVPLVVSAVPYFARLAEQSLLAADRGSIEAAEALGAGRLRIVFRVLLRESFPLLVNASIILLVAFVSYTTIVGIVGGGGVGDFAIRYGYNLFQTDVMVFSVAVIVLLVQVFQVVGNRLVRRWDHRIVR